MKYDPSIHHRRSIRLRGYEYSQTGAYFVTVCTQGRECFFGEVVDGEMCLNDAGEIAQSTWQELPQRFPGLALDQFVIMPNHVHGIVVLVGAQFLAPDNAPPTIQGVTDQSMINHAPTPGKTAPRVGAQFIAPHDAATTNRGVINRGVPNQGVINHAPTLGEPVITLGAQFIAPKGTTPTKQGSINRAPTLGELIRTFKAATTRHIRLTALPGFRWQRNYYEHIIRDEKSLGRLREYIINNPLRWHLDELNPDYPLPAHEASNVQSRL